MVWLCGTSAILWILQCSILRYMPYRNACLFITGRRFISEGEYVEMTGITKEQSGLYECISSNDISPPDVRTVQVTVNCKSSVSPTDMKELPVHSLTLTRSFMIIISLVHSPHRSSGYFASSQHRDGCRTERRAAVWSVSCSSCWLSVVQRRAPVCFLF